LRGRSHSEPERSVLALTSCTYRRPSCANLGRRCVKRRSKLVRKRVLVESALHIRYRRGDVSPEVGRRQQFRRALAPSRSVGVRPTSGPHAVGTAHDMSHPLGKWLQLGDQMLVARGCGQLFSQHFRIRGDATSYCCNRTTSG
jgi:hypothetical protein